MGSFKDLTGKKFGKLTVLGINNKNKGKIRWDVICECGNKTIVRGSNLSNGHTQTCGCSIKKHGMEGSRFYHIWEGMHRRSKSTDKQYENCILCERWKIFKNFKDDMYELYIKHSKEFGEKDTTIDRIDNNLGYFKGNCRWNTWAGQNRNTSRNHFITYKGETLCLQDFAIKFGISYNNLSSRIRSGWNIESALITPIKKYIKHEGRYSCAI
jgi:hypothetical protein